MLTSLTRRSLAMVLFTLTVCLVALGQTTVDIDSPTSVSTFSGNFAAGGWAINPSSTVSSVVVSVDNTFYVNATVGTYRPDVCNAMGNYPGCPYVGYDYSLNTAQFTDGVHTLSIKTTTTSGVQATASRSFYTSNGNSPPAYQPFGADAELLAASICNHNIGCPIIDYAAQAGALWIRFFAVWSLLQPTQSSYQWGELPWQVWYAQQKGLKVYFTMTWPPQWANGATSNNPPYGTSCGDCGRTVLNSNYTYNFFYNLVTQFNGSNVSGCTSNTVASCHPKVLYFGVMNEPDNINNYNDTYYDTNSGNYLNTFVNMYLSPAHQAIKAANSQAFVVAPDLSTGGASCGGFSLNCNWDSSWIYPLNLYFSSLYDVISIHGYNTSHSVTTGNVDRVWNNYDSGAKPIWVSENANGTASDTTSVFTDEQSRSNYWKTTFYWLEGSGAPCSSADSLLCTNTSGATVPNTAFFSAYQNVYSPH